MNDHSPHAHALMAGQSLTAEQRIEKLEESIIILASGLQSMALTVAALHEGNSALADILNDMNERLDGLGAAEAPEPIIIVNAQTGETVALNGPNLPLIDEQGYVGFQFPAAPSAEDFSADEFKSFVRSAVTLLVERGVFTQVIADCLQESITYIEGSIPPRGEAFPEEYVEAVLAGSTDSTVTLAMNWALGLTDGVFMMPSKDATAADFAFMLSSMAFFALTPQLEYQSL